MNTLWILATALLLITISPNIQTYAQTDASAPTSVNSGSKLEYKVVSGFKQPFNDDLQLHLSKGWMPVGGIAVTTWNDDLYFAHLLSRRPMSSPTP